MKSVRIRSLRIFLEAIYILSLVPLLLIGRYDFPSADDFGQGSAVRHAFLESGSFAACLSTAFSETARIYRVWVGYFTSMFFTVLQPAAFSERAYSLTVVLVLFMLTAGVLFFCRSLFYKVLGISRDYAYSVGFLLLLLMIQRLPGRNEALYWYSGAINYTFTVGLALVFLCAVLSYLTAGSQKTLLLILCAVLAFFCGGINYLTALTLMIGLFFIIIALWYLKKLSVNKGIFLIFVSFAAGFLMSCLAPGNRIRGGFMQGMSAVSAILASLEGFFTECLLSDTGWVQILVFVMLGVLFLQMVKETSFTFPLPGIVLLMGCGISAAAMTPPFYSGGNIDAGRIRATVYIQYVLLMSLCLFYLIGWAQKRFLRKEAKAQEALQTLPARATMILCALSALFIAGGLFCTMRNPAYFTSVEAFRDLRNGKAKAYAELMEERIMILHGEEKNVVLPRIESAPALLFFSDITSDETDWKNTGMARFYDKETVRLEEPQ